VGVADGPAAGLPLVEALELAGTDAERRYLSRRLEETSSQA
jgi:hypothetical protein